MLRDQITINTILFDPKVIIDRKFLPGKKEGESFMDYRLRLESSGEMLKMFGHASVKDINAGLTEFQMLGAKEPKLAADIIDANARIWLKKKEEAAKNKEEYNTRKNVTTIFDNVDFFKLRKEGETIDIEGNTVDIRMLPNGVKGTYNNFFYFKMNELQKNPNFKVVKIWENKNFKKNSLFDSIRKDLHKSKNNSLVDAVLFKASLELLKQIEFWQHFFKKYNIKIHLEHREWSYETIAKQIALELVNGCSVGRLKIGRAHV